MVMIKRVLNLEPLVSDWTVGEVINIAALSIYV